MIQGGDIVRSFVMYNSSNDINTKSIINHFTT